MGSCGCGCSRDGRAVCDLEHGLGTVTALAVTPDGRHITSGGSDGIVRLWDVAALDKLIGWTADSAVMGCVFCPGAPLATGEARGACTHSSFAAHHSRMRSMIIPAVPGLRISGIISPPCTTGCCAREDRPSCFGTPPGDRTHHHNHHERATPSITDIARCLAFVAPDQ